MWNEQLKYLVPIIAAILFAAITVIPALQTANAATTSSSQNICLSDIIAKRKKKFEDKSGVYEFFSY